MSREDVKRYIEMEVPAIGMVQNEPASVVCLNPPCEETIEVDPSTLVLEDEDAKGVRPRGRRGDGTDARRYCCCECRNSRYSDTDIER